MKLKYIFGAMLSALLLASCSDDDPFGQYTDITLDKTFAPISTDGGDIIVTVKAASNWELIGLYQKITKNDDGTSDTIYTPLPNNPAWLTVSQVSGNAGETTLTFHADATEGGREAEVCFGMNGKKQYLVVRQGVLLASDASCEEVINGPDGKNFRVTGTCMSISNTKFGNWYLSDGTGTIYIYGTADKEDKLANYPIDGTDGWKFEVGDVITVEGPKTTYGSTIELVNVKVIKVEKSLLKIMSEAANIGVDGGEVEVKVAYKGSGAYFDIAPEAKLWVNFTDSKFIPGIKTIFEQNPSDTIVFHFNVSPNTGEGRSTQILFRSSIYNEDKKNTDFTEMPFQISQDANIVIPPKGNGTKASPYNVSAALAFTKALGENVKSENDVYVTGIISSVRFTYSAQYGTATYNISDDGNEDNVFTVYSSYFFDNQPWEEGQTQIAVGDKVVVCGKVINYNGTTPEFASKENWLVSLNGNTGGNGGGNEAEQGTAENPYDVDGINAIAAQLEQGQTSEADYYFKGKISSIKYTFSAQYGTAQFNVSNDGSTEGTQFLVYGTYYLGNRAWAEGDTQIAVGDEVVICGKITNYNGTLETANKKNYIYSLNGKTE